MANSYIPPSQQWNPNHFNFSHLQLEHGFDYSTLSLQGNQQQRQQQQQQQLRPQQDQLNYQYSQSQVPTPPHSSSSLHGAFTMPSNQQLPTQGSPSQYGNGIQHDYVPNPYANQQQQQSATHVPASNSYLPNTFNFSSSSRATSSAMNLDAAQTSNVSSTFITPQGSETQQRQTYYHPPSTTTKESIPLAKKRSRSVTYTDELNPDDADLDSEPSDQRDRDRDSSASKAKLYVHSKLPGRHFAH
jgi:hypothetical protein